jgi:hypothetical protein
LTADSLTTPPPPAPAPSIGHTSADDDFISRLQCLTPALSHLVPSRLDCPTPPPAPQASLESTSRTQRHSALTAKRLTARVHSIRRFQGRARVAVRDADRSGSCRIARAPRCCERVREPEVALRKPAVAAAARHSAACKQEGRKRRTRRVGRCRQPRSSNQTRLVNDSSSRGGAFRVVLLLLLLLLPRHRESAAESAGIRNSAHVARSTCVACDPASERSVRVHLTYSFARDACRGPC